MKKQILYTVCLAALMSSCHIYKSYDRPEIDTKGLYRDPLSVNDTLTSDTTNMGNLPWKEVFTDPKLQEIIQLGLDQNTDLQSAMLNVKQAEASFMSARMAYAPSLVLSPQGGVSSFNKSNPTWTWSAPVAASWEIDLFGKLLNSKRKAKVALLQSEAYKQAVQTQVISAIANYYYTLLMLDKQLSITEETSVIWDKSLETMRAMKEAGMVNEAAIVQSEANSYMVKASIPDIKQQIKEAENALSLLLKQAPQKIERGSIDEQNFPEALNAGIPAQLLANRPDVKAAEMALAMAYYGTNEARANFYPQISISGTLGWTNQAGNMIVNPGKMILSALGSLTQPLFYRGANIAQLKIAKAQQESAKLSFEQAILNAGSEVSNALTSYESAKEKSIQREKQINSLEKSVEYTQQLLTLWTSTYLEVLTAQQSLLSAQLSQVSDSSQRMQSIVNLYHALGGGR